MTQANPHRCRPVRRLRPRLLSSPVPLACLLVLTGALGPPGRLRAQPAGAPDSVRTAPHRTQGSRLFPPRLSKSKFVYLPRVYYSADRGYGLGGQVFRLFHWPDPTSPQASDIRLKGRMTSRGQTEAEIVSRLYWGGGRYFVKMKLSYRTLAERFYGIGPATSSSNEEVYKPQQVQAYVEVFRRLYSHLKLGLRYEFERVRLLDVEDGAQLQRRDIRGTSTSGQNILGVGMLADWDSRDSKFHPTSGSHHQFFYIFFDDNLGSDLDFHNYNLDLRKYFLISHGEVLAAQFFVFGTNREVPFWRLAAMGGRSHTRAYRRGRYRDRVLVAFQGEYRIPLGQRFGAVMFGGLGDVGPALSTLQLEHMKPTAGAGLRLRTGAADGVRVRLDGAFGRSSAHFYLALDEAF